MVNFTAFTGDWIMDVSIFLFFFVFFVIFIQGIVIFISFFKKGKSSGQEDIAVDNFITDHRVSIIVPVYNEEKRLTSCIKNIVRSDYPKDLLEVLIVDDGSTDKTVSLAEKFAKKYSYIKVIKANHDGKSAALNLGVKKAKHDLILSLDVDVDITKDFIHKILYPFKDEKVGATNAMALIKKENKGILSAFQRMEFKYNNLIRSSFSKLFNNGIWFFGAAAAYRKSVLKKTGGFRMDRMTEDMDISLEVFRAGYKVLTVSDAFYFTEACYSIPMLFRQRMRWFFGGLQSTFANRNLLNKKSFAINYLFANMWFWSVFSLIAIPIIIYQVNYWMPVGFTEIFWYLFRWFSVSGPVMVLYKIPVWGLNLVSIFGVLAGILTTILLLVTSKRNNSKLSLASFIVIFFYFPYTILLNASFVLGFFYHLFSKKKGFVR